VPFLRTQFKNRLHSNPLESQTLNFAYEKFGKHPASRTSQAKLRVCHLVSGDLWAGAEVMAWHLILHLRQFSELEVFALILNEGRLAAELRKADVPIRIIDEQKRSFVHLVLKTKALLGQWSPHVIHSHRYKENILAFVSRSRSSGTRLVATQHGMPEGDPRRLKIGARVIDHLNRLILARGFDRLVSVSQDIKANFIGRFNFSANQLSVIYNGLALPELRAQLPLAVNLWWARPDALFRSRVLHCWLKWPERLQQKVHR
jgi:hypothetical protein